MHGYDQRYVWKLSNEERLIVQYPSRIEWVVESVGHGKGVEVVKGCAW
jgi:hypothetical protein